MALCKPTTLNNKSINLPWTSQTRITHMSFVNGGIGLSLIKGTRGPRLIFYFVRVPWPRKKENLCGNSADGLTMLMPALASPHANLPPKDVTL